MLFSTDPHKFNILFPPTLQSMFRDENTDDLSKPIIFDFLSRKWFLSCENCQLLIWI